MPQIQQRVSKIFTQNYKDQIFLLWWQKGKISLNRLLPILPPDEDGDIPGRTTVITWLREEFKPRAEHLDAEFYAQVEAQAMQEKAQMLRKHVKVGETMQDMAMEYLEQHKEELTINSATRLLIEGVRIERESRGIPDALDKMSEKSNEELLEELGKLLTSGDIDIQPYEENL